ncbi:MAG TPA: ABC transporter permease [Planctomycetota bacterium]|nr:ABC transporter permease [Planctomycetota bacterium]
MPISTLKRSDTVFLAGLALFGGLYLFLIIAMLVADASFTTPSHVWQSLQSPEIRYSIKLSLISCSVTALLSVWCATAIGYVMSRFDFRGKQLIEAILDIPIVLPPLVVGLSLLILFQTPPGKFIEHYVPVTYAIPSVILAQFSVACAFAVRTMRGTFDLISPRSEQVAMTLGCSRAQAFWIVALPEARHGILTAATLAWARSLGEFGPILVFSGATRFHTEVLPTTVFLELSTGNIESAVAVSLLMVAAAAIVLTLVRVFGGPDAAAGRAI